jgi:hypothetical protein
MTSWADIVECDDLALDTDKDWDIAQRHRYTSSTVSVTSYIDDVDDIVDENTLTFSPILPTRQFPTLDERTYELSDSGRYELRKWINYFPESRTLWDEIIMLSKNRYNDQYNYLGINISSQKRRQNLIDWTHINYSKKSNC